VPGRVPGRVHVRTLVGVVLTLAILVPLGWLWWDSRTPASWSAAAMGTMDFGGGPRASHAGHGGMTTSGTSVRDLDTPRDRAADVVVDLVARQGEVRLPSGRRITGYSLNGRTPGPLISATVGQLVEVRVRNADVADGIALHWHGVDVPNAEDGVAGVTQDAIMPGTTHTYRWIAPHAGTFWYHSHQLSHVQVDRGLLGPLVIKPREPEEQAVDALALSHVYAGVATLNGRTGDQHVAAEPGQRVRVRVVNTDNGPAAAWVGGPFRLLAEDGYDVHDPAVVSGRSVVVPAGGRADLEVVVPSDGSGVGVQLAGGRLVVGPAGAKAPRATQPAKELDRRTYGTPTTIGFDTGKADRRFRYAIGKRPGFVHGKPGMQWTVNGHMGQAMPMFVVRRGDVVHVRISNSSGEVHPMHLHGHHAVVLSRDGKAVTGSPWWFDSLDVRDGETFEVAFLADNPGIWMDHCHNLKHASQGLVTHLMYEGVTTPYRLGSASGNEPE
jgi:FtsP/CotA-like multicopper oxidase with cupredoxin domain